MGHKRVEQSEDRREYKIHHRQCRFLLRLVFAENVSLGSLNKPVAIIAPNKVIEALRDRVELIFAIRSVDYVDRLVQTREHFDGVNGQRLLIDCWRSLARAMHLTKAGDVPEFCREVTAFLDLFFVEPDIL